MDVDSTTRPLNISVAVDTSIGHRWTTLTTTCGRFLAQYTQTIERAAMVQKSVATVEK
jgi:hypothetical protein